jgi:hypothetical protein
VSFTAEGAIDAIVATLQAVDGIGQVHNRRRIVRNAGEIKDRLTSDGRLNAAMVSWLSMPETLTDFGSPTRAGAVSTLNFRIELFYGVNDDDASEVDFRALVWNVQSAFNSAGLIYAGASHQDRVTVDEIGHLMLADLVLVHYARFTIAFRGRVSP